MPRNAEIEALEALLVENPEFERLEELLDQFNIFEAMGAVRQELRHSDFLSFLLNPQQPHGLGDAFLKRLLQKVCVSTDGAGASVGPIDLDIWSLEDVLVQREWESIDILVLDETHHLAVIIENKIGTSEYSDQLRRYRAAVSHHYPGWQAIGIYLTPGGETPSDETYIALDYGTVCHLLEALAQSRATTLGSDVLTLIQHYTQMLRRHIVGDSEIAELCRRIYQKHQRALDLIFEYRPDRQGEMYEALQAVIPTAPGLLLDHSTKAAVRFVPDRWDRIPQLLEGFKWTPSGRLLLFEFGNSPDFVNLKLVIGPGPQQIRERLFEVAKQHQPPFRPSSSKLYNVWTTIYSRPFISKTLYASAPFEELTEEIRKHWKTFVESDLPAIIQIIVETFAGT